MASEVLQVHEGEAVTPTHFLTPLISIRIAAIGCGYVVSAFRLGDDGKPDYDQLVYCCDFEDGNRAVEVYSGLCLEWGRKVA
jgi:hypothetical protein